MTRLEHAMTAVMIGIDLHKGSHTAVAISAAEEPLGDLRVHASAAQAGQLAAQVRLLQAGDTNKNDPAGLHPEHRLFGQATPEPATTLRPATQPREPLPPKPAAKKTRPNP
jgi:hypothetical protein